MGSGVLFENILLLKSLKGTGIYIYIYIYIYISMQIK